MFGFFGGDRYRDSFGAASELAGYACVRLNCDAPQLSDPTWFLIGFTTLDRNCIQDIFEKGVFRMAKRWLGLSAAKDTVIVVDAKIPDEQGDPIVIMSDDTWRVQKGDRAAAYSVLHQQCADYIKENCIDAVVVKASAVAGKGSATLGFLLSAEVRGVVIASAASQCPVKALSKAVISRTYGERKVDEYVADDAFWADQTTGGNLRKLSRETTILLIAARNS
jgi:hypothetical protein